MMKKRQNPLTFHKYVLHNISPDKAYPTHFDTVGSASAAQNKRNAVCSEYDAMGKAYLTSAKILIQDRQGKPYKVYETDVVLLLCHHALELTLKSICIRENIDTEAIHSLIDLWNLLEANITGPQPVLYDYNLEPPEIVTHYQPIREIRDIIQKMSTYSAKSMAWRYPRKKLTLDSPAYNQFANNKVLYASPGMIYAETEMLIEQLRYLYRDPIL